MDRTLGRIRRLQRKLHASVGCEPWRIPDKPARMHWTTYKRLSGELYAAIMEREAFFAARAAKLLGRADRLLAEREYLRP